jgi:glycine/D-amino acid oxidase-like deaminating enzyme
VTLFDSKGIGKGASGIATGLLHPYPGEQGRRSWKASEGIAATLALIEEVEASIGRSIATRGGILRVVQDDEQRDAFLNHAERYGDVESVDGSTFRITSGITIHCQSYLQGLWKMVEQRGGALVCQQISSLSTLAAEFDHIVLTVGGGIAAFPESKELRFERTKGQVLTAEVPEHLQKGLQSLIGKGYLATGESPHRCYLGSTYERPFVSEDPDPFIAAEEILPKLGLAYPHVDQLRLMGCSAGLRVSRKGHYYPIIARFSPDCWSMTAMGSRGLMYHAYLSNLLSQAILSGDVSLLPQEVLIDKTFSRTSV